MKVGINEVKDILLGETPIVKVYRGEDVIWERGGLPSGYTRVQYLESTRTQYIDTGYKPNSNTKVEIQFMNITKTLPSALFGSRDEIGRNEFCVFINEGATTSRNFRFDYTGTETTLDHYAGGYSNLNTIYTIIKDKEKNYTNGIESTSNRVKTFETNYPMYLWAINTTGTTVTGKSIARIYYCKVWNNGTLVRDFVPCLDNNNRPCMYDLVTRQPFYNRGTGKFIYA